jgi:hypothetical protein
MTRRATTTSACVSGFLLVASVVLGLVPTSPSALAHTFTKTDGNDSAGRLDLKSVSVRHKGASLEYTFTTYERWKANASLIDSFFLIAIDEQGDGTPNKCAFVYYHGGLRGELTNCLKKYISALRVSKPSGTTARLTYPAGGKSHHWFAASYWKGIRCAKGCYDYAPNKNWLFHDLVPPTASWVTTVTGDGLSTQLSETTTVPVAFAVSDADTSVATWRIDRMSGCCTWTPFDSGSGSGTIDHDLSFAEGQAYGLRLVATDIQGNVSQPSQVLTLHVPFDDGNAQMLYSAGWSGASAAGYFLGTFDSASTGSATLTFTFTGSKVWLLGGPGNGQATFNDETDTGWIVNETSSTTPGTQLGGMVWGTNGTHTVTLTITSGTFVVDGIAVVTD